VTEPVRRVYILGDESEPDAGDWVHAETPHHLHVRMATSQQHQILQLVVRMLPREESKGAWDVENRLRLAIPLAQPCQLELSILPGQCGKVIGILIS
jgi:hypothetical protein